MVTVSSGFGAILRKHRTDAGLTQEELAERASVSARVVSDLERGVTHAPQRHTIQSLVEGLNLGAEDRADLVSSAGRRVGRAVRTSIHPAVFTALGGFLGASPAGPLVARQEELDRILRVADVVAGGGGQLVLLQGEAGVGKTRLAQEAMRALRDRGFFVASGRCYEPQQAVPYYPVVEALTAMYECAPVRLRSQVAKRWPHLRYLLADQISRQPEFSGRTEHEQQALFRATIAFLVEMATTIKPVALLVDDLHWADSGSLDLIRHLARYTRASPILFIGTHRHGEVGRRHRLERMLRDLHRESLSESIRLQPLTLEGTAALIGATFGPKAPPQEFAALIHRHTEGNPLFTREVLRALAERGEVHEENGTWTYGKAEEVEVPESIRSAIAERASRLSSRAQEIVHEASTLGHTFRFEHLQAMKGRSEHEIESVLEEAKAAHLLRETGEDEYSFNHVLTQLALYSEISGRKKRRLHLAAAEALEREGADRRPEQLSELVRHFVKGGRPERALPYSLLAGEAAERVFAQTEAERHYRMALQLARDLGDRKREAEGALRLGGVLRFLAQYSEALKVMDGAAAFFRAVGDSEGEARTEAMMGMVHFERGTSDEGISRMQPRLQSLQDHVSFPMLSLLYEAQSQLFFGTGQYREHLDSAERWLRVASTIGNKGAIALARGRHGTALMMLGRAEEGTAALEEAIALAEASGETYALMHALNDLAECYEMAGAFGKALSLRERYLDVTTQMNYHDGVSFALCGMAHTLILVGNWRGARAHLDRALGRTPSRTSWYSGTPCGVSAQLCMLEGNEDTARQQIAQTLKIAQRNQDLQTIRFAELLQAELDLRCGLPEAAVARLEPLLDRPGLEEGQVAQLLPVLAEARLAQGQDLEALRQAEVTVHEALRRAKAGCDRVRFAQALRVHGMLLHRKGHLDEAEGAFKEAISLASSMPYPYAHARTLIEYGILARDRGQNEEARKRLDEALTISRALGSKSEIERADRALVGPRSQDPDSRSIDGRSASPPQGE